MKIGKTENFIHRVGTLWFVVLCISFLYTYLNAAEESDVLPTAQNFHQWGSITLFNGLPSDNVRAIAQTPDGAMWFGTDNGLARFDGRRVQTVSLPDTATSKIFALRLATADGLWIASDNGAFLYKNGVFKKVDGTQDLSITAILPADPTLLATANGLLLKIKLGENGVLNAERAVDEIFTGSDGRALKFTSLVQDGKHVLVGTSSRSLMIFENGGLFETNSSPRPYFINALAQDSKGNIWAGVDGGKIGSGLLLLRDIGRPDKIGAGLGDVLSLLSDNNGGVWAGTSKNGLFHFAGDQELDHFTFENTSGSLRSNTIYSILVDREGVIWIGTNRGVSRFDASSPFQEIISDSPNSNFIRTIYSDLNGQIFAGTNRGLFIADGRTWTAAKGFEKKVIYSVGATPGGGLLVATASGVQDLSSKPVSEGDTRAIVNIQGRTYTAVFDRGVAELSGDNQTNIIFPNDGLTSLFAGTDKLFIGTADEGVFAFDGRETKGIVGPESFGGGAVWKIAADGENRLWIGSEHGLSVFKDAQVKRIIIDHDVRDLVINGADIWAATSDAGLLHLRYDDIFGWLVSNLNVERGLPSEKTFALTTLNTGLLIGTNRGVVTYNPSNVAPKIIPVRILSRRLHEPDELSSTIELEYPQNSLLVEVSGQSSRTFPEEFQYAFLLKNSNGEIIDKRISPDAQFAPENLSPGDYSVEARAYNRDLLSSEPLIVRFSVARAPFPWTATALGILLAVALVALVWAIIERSHIKQRNRELAAARFDLATEAERERRRIARDLHDQTLADLRNLMMMSDQLSTDNSEFRAEIESVSTEIRRICEDLSPSVLENVGLVAALEFLLTHTIENYSFHAAENLEERIEFPINIQLQIYRITQEVLTNIKRHSLASEVEMNIDVTADGEFVLTIEDNGAPFNPASIKTKGRGVANIRSRVSLIKANTSWQTSETGGTTFELRRRPTV